MDWSRELADKEESDFKEGLSIFSVVDLEFEAKMAALDIYNVLRGMLISVHHEDLILLYTLTRIHPKLPRYISGKYKERIGREEHHLVGSKQEILTQADQFTSREKEDISELPKKTEPLLYESEEDHDIKELDEIDVRSDLSDAEPEVKLELDEPDPDPDSVTNCLDHKKDVFDEIKKRPRAKKVRPSSKKHAKTDYECNHCEFVGAKLLQLTRHKRRIHNEYVCKECDFLAGSKDQLLNHAKESHQSTSLSCDQCEYKASGKRYLQEHMESKHMGIRHYCDLCPFSSSFRRNLKTHVNVAHEGQALPTFMCDQCDYQTNQKGSLTVHMKQKHEEIKCEHCSFVSKGQIMLKKHMKTSHYEAFKEIMRVNPKRYMYNKRIAAVDKSKRFLCDRCEYHTHDKFLLRHHLSATHHIGSHPCHLCDHVGESLWHLEQHMTKHGSFPCTQCDFVGNLNKELTAHKKNVHQEKKYSCDHCDYFSSRADNVKTHSAAMHEGMTYPCNMCEYNARRPGDLKKHQRKMHKIENILM